MQTSIPLKKQAVRRPKQLVLTLAQRLVTMHLLNLLLTRTMYLLSLLVTLTTSLHNPQVTPITFSLSRQHTQLLLLNRERRRETLLLLGLIPEELLTPILHTLVVLLMHIPPMLEEQSMLTLHTPAAQSTHTVLHSLQLIRI
jgi:hypothetical protein